MLRPMKRIIAVLAVLALVGCGGEGGDKDVFCADGADFIDAGDDATARDAAVATMLEESPKKIKDSVQALQDEDPGSDAYEQALTEVTSFINENCDTP